MLNTEKISIKRFSGYNFMKNIKFISCLNRQLGIYQNLRRSSGKMLRLFNALKLKKD